MAYERVQKSSSWSPQPQEKTSRFAPRPFAVPSQTPTQQDIENEAFREYKHEAFGLQLQAKNGTITPEGQERLTVLQAKMDSLWEQRRESRQRQNGTSFLDKIFTGDGQRATEPAAPIQAKVTIGEAGDKYEQEADRVAAQVVSQINAPAPQQSSPGQTLQRQETPQEEEVQMQPVAGSIQRLEQPKEEEVQMQPAAGSIQREEMPQEQEVQMQPMVQRLSDAGGMAATPHLETSIQQARGSGQPLADNIREPMERAFGTDFSGVKVHTDAQSNQLNQSIQAKAFTTGQDIFFRQGAYDPGSRGGQELIAHELTHVVQQNGGAVQRQPDEKRSLIEPIQGTALDEKEGNITSHKVARQPTWPTYVESVKPRRAGMGGERTVMRQALNNPTLPISSTSEGVIQRLSYADSPVSWAPVDEVTRSAEGAFGVFFVKKGGDTIVVKPTDDPGNAEFANKFLEQGMGFQAPQMKTYAKHGTEGTAITNLLQANSGAGRTSTEIQEQVESANYYMVMSKVEGKSIQTLDDSEAVEFIQNANALVDVGRLMAADAFLGNTDRLVGGIVNLGNFFYQVANTLQPGIATIDNDSSFGKGESSATGNLSGDLDSKFHNIEILMDATDRQGYINNFLRKFRQVHRSHANALAAIDEAFVTTNIGKGIWQGLQDMANVFQTNKDLVRSLRSINDTYGENNKRDVSAAKGLAHYVEARVSKGVDQDTAVNQLKTYVEYRAKRNKTRVGLKWMTKLFNKTGF